MASYLLLSDGTSHLLLSDGASALTLSGPIGVGAMLTRIAIPKYALPSYGIPAYALPGKVSGPATRYTLTAPTPASGYPGTASGNFTVAPVSGTWPAGTVLTPGTTGSGTFTPTSISPVGSSSYTFTYTPVSGDAPSVSICTANGGTFTSDPTAVTYTVTVDTTPPAIASASVNSAGTTLTVHFTETESPPVLPASGVSGFSLSGTLATIASGAISSTTGTFTLSGHVFQGETVKLAYTPGNVTDSATTPNAMVAVSNVSVANNSTYTDTTAPVIRAAAVSPDGTKVYVYLTETESPPCLPASSVAGFSLGGTSATIASGAISGTTVTLSLTGAVTHAQTVTVSYSSSTGNVTDSATSPNAMATQGPIAAPMGILSTIEAAANVGPYQVRQIGSAWFVGPWAVSSDGKLIGPYEIDDTNSRVGPWRWHNDGTNQFLGPYLVR